MGEPSLDDGDTSSGNAREPALPSGSWRRAEAALWLRVSSAESSPIGGRWSHVCGCAVGLAGRVPVVSRKVRGGSRSGLVRDGSPVAGSGLRLTDGRALVVKVRPWQQRLIACGQVQEHLHSKGFPAPQVLVSPTQQGDFAISAETLVNGGELLETDSGSAAQFAEALHLLVQEAPRVESVGSLDPSPAWVGWDHKATRLWPDPDDRPGDLNTLDRRRWLDDVGAAAREQLLALDQPLVIGHGDWYSANLRWTHRRLRVVHDWDSVIPSPKPPSPVPPPPSGRAPVSQARSPP